MKKILVIGLIGYSLFYELDYFPKRGESIIAKKITKEIGAKAFNEAYTIKLLGGKVKFVSSIGNDEFKDIIVNDLNNINLDSKIIYKEGPNTIASIMSYKNNNVFVSKGVELDINDFDIIKDEINNSDIILLTKEINDNLLGSIIEYANKLNKYIILNLSPIDNIKYIDLVNLVIMNEIEYDQFDHFITLEKLLSLKCSLIITMGKKPISFHRLPDGDIYEMPVPRVKEVIDTTGAGDIFLASLAYKLSSLDNLTSINDEQMIEIITYASKISSKSVKYKYVMESIKQSTSK